jgi:hypothetical protein
LANTYASLRSAAGPTAEVFVLGYPQIVGAVRQGGGCSYLTGQERPIIRDVVAQLNGVISRASAAAGFTYVDATAAGSPFLGYELCTRCLLHEHQFRLPLPSESERTGRLSGSADSAAGRVPTGVMINGAS